MDRRVVEDGTESRPTRRLLEPAPLLGYSWGSSEQIMGHCVTVLASWVLDIGPAIVHISS
jgi:hypothetical protein